MPKSQSKSPQSLLVQVIVSCETSFWQGSVPEFERLITKTIESTLEHLKWGHPVEISVVLTGDREIQELNALHRNQDKPTNVLSFPSFEDLDENLFIHEPHPLLLGDLVFAYETIEREAQEQGKTFTNHLTHLVVHGTLHLLGYDHEAEEQAERMEALEVEILTKLSIPNPYTLPED